MSKEENRYASVISFGGMLTLLTDRGCTTKYDNGPVRVLAKTAFFERRSECYTLWSLGIGGHRKRVKSDKDGSGLVK